MNTYKSNTGYVKNLLTSEFFTADTIYLGIYDKAENYSDVTKEEYEEYIKEKDNGNGQDTK